MFALWTLPTFDVSVPSIGAVKREDACIFSHTNLFKKRATTQRVGMLSWIVSLKKLERITESYLMSDTFCAIQIAYEKNIFFGFSVF